MREKLTAVAVTAGLLVYGGLIATAAWAIHSIHHGLLLT